MDSGHLMISISSERIFEYLGNIFSDNSASDQIFDWADGDSLISLKYFINDNTALRLGIGTNFSSFKTDENVQAFDDELNVIPGEVVRNIFISEAFRYGMAVGLEKNFGYKRWRYHHGFEAFFSFDTYRNRLINGNPLPLYIGAITDDKSGVNFNIRASILTGFEYMISSNFALEFELKWGAMVNREAEGEFIIVEENSEGDVIEVLKNGENKSTSFSIDNMPQPSLKANIYFPLNNK